MQENMKEYLTEKEAREKRLEVYTEKIQEKVLSRSSETIRQLVEERHRQKMTQQEIADITGIKPSNMARFESGGRVPTLIVLEKYANALAYFPKNSIYQYREFVEDIGHKYIVQEQHIRKMIGEDELWLPW